MSKIKKELLNGRGFKDEKHLFEFLENCKDESWKAELKKYFNLETEEIEDETEEVKSEEISEVENEIVEETEEVEEEIEEE